jgi:hypothetical protein
LLTRLTFLNASLLSSELRFHTWKCAYFSLCIVLLERWRYFCGHGEKRILQLFMELFLDKKKKGQISQGTQYVRRRM